MKNPRPTKLNQMSWAVRLGLASGLALLFIVALLWGLQDVTPARADPGILYVDGAIGSDTTDCSNPTAPCETIDYALGRAGTDDEIHVAEGTYKEHLSSFLDSFTIIGAGPDHTIIDAEGTGRVLDIMFSHSVVISGVAIANGNSGYGSGIYVGMYDSTDELFLANVVISNNVSNGFGGGLYVEAPFGITQVVLDNVTIVSNTATESGGGVYFDAAGPVFVSETHILSNTSAYGGGIYVYGGNATLTNVQLRGNVATAEGGGVYIEGSNATLINNVIADNQADEGEGGGMNLVQSSSVQLLHNTIARNTGSSGICVENDSTVMITNTILVNHNVGISLTDGNTAMVNGVLWDSSTPITISQSSGAVVSVQNQHVGDPAFASDGYHLELNSSAIGKGVDAGVVDDIDGEPRVGIPDLGADEYGPTPITGLAATSDSPTFLGDLTMLTATVTGGDPVSYTWAFGDGETGDEATVTHIYPAVGTYTAVVTAANAVSVVTATTSVTVHDEAILSVTNDSPTLLGFPTTLTATLIGGNPVSYTWAFGDGETGEGATVTHIYPAVGTYTAVVTPANAINMITAATTVTVHETTICQCQVYDLVPPGWQIAIDRQGLNFKRVVLSDLRVDRVEVSLMLAAIPPHQAELTTSVKIREEVIASWWETVPNMGSYVRYDHLVSTSDYVREGDLVSLFIASPYNLPATMGYPSTMSLCALPRLSIGDVIVTEGSGGITEAVFDVTLSAASTKPITVSYATAGGTAIAPADYTEIPTVTLTFAPGETSQPITVSIQSDLDEELDEAFWVNLGNPVNALINDGQGQCTIVDDDGQPSVDYSAASYAIDEAIGSAAITVTLNRPHASAVTVEYATADGGAISGADYTPVSGTLIFTPGLESQTFEVPIIDDTLDEIDETIILSLSNPENATLGANNPATLTITDNDDPPTVAFGSATYSMDEDAGSATIGVTLSAASGLTVTVEYSTTNGTATAGEDYTAIGGTLVFAPGVTSQSFVVAITDDEVGEGEETVTLTLFNAENAIIGGNNPAVLTITEEFKVYLPLVVKNG